jgi:hypothetical protein
LTEAFGIINAWLRYGSSVALALDERAIGMDADARRPQMTRGPVRGGVQHDVPVRVVVQAEVRFFEAVVARIERTKVGPNGNAGWRTCIMNFYARLVQQAESTVNSAIGRVQQ